MDWFERWWGLNPDGGSGTAEAGVVMTIVLVVGVGVVMGSSRLRAAIVRMLRALAVRSTHTPR